MCLSPNFCLIPFLLPQFFKLLLTVFIIFINYTFKSFINTFRHKFSSTTHINRCPTFYNKPCKILTILSDHMLHILLTSIFLISGKSNNYFQIWILLPFILKIKITVPVSTSENQYNSSFRIPKSLNKWSKSCNASPWSHHNHRLIILW